MGDDTDIRAELRHAYKQVQSYINVTHVKSHQNGTRPLSKLSPAAMLNVSLDRYMKNMHSLANIPHNHIAPHLPRQKNSLRNHYDRLTCDYPTSLTKFSNEYEAEK